MIIIGLTGPTGAGKSSVVTVAKKLDIKTIDCDKIARDVTKKGEPALEKLAEFFGDDILKNGSLVRSKLAQKAFSDEQNTKMLNHIIFPFIKSKLANIVSDEIENGTKVILLDAPTLYESGADILCDKIIAVLSSKEIRQQRIIERDNLNEQSALLRMSAGKSDEFYKKADFLINNNGTIKEFLEDIEKILTDIIGGNPNG